MSISASFTGSSSLGEERLQNGKKSVKIEYPCSSNGDCAPYSITFGRGIYKIELFGASGGNSTYSGKTQFGGKGGMVSSILRLSESTSFFLFVGGRGSNREDSLKLGGYNGGGMSNSYRGCGGGATDIRTSENDLYSRIIVAGGGGGAIANQDTLQNGGSGGGLKGEPGGLYQSYIPCYGSQDGCEGGSSSENGQFGFGSSSSLGGGGGGFWGGGGATGCGSSGGSSYYGSLNNSFSYSGANIGDGYAFIVVLAQNTCNRSDHDFLSFLLSLLTLLICPKTS